MSVPSQPADPQRHGNYPGATPPRPPTSDTAPCPPISPDDQLDDYPHPPQPPDALPQTVQADPPRPPRLGQPPRGKRHAPKNDRPAVNLTAQQRLLLLDTWRRSGLPAGDFAAQVGLSKHTLYAWKRKFEAEGPAGLEDKPRGGPHGSRLPEVTKRAIL